MKKARGVYMVLTASDLVIMSALLLQIAGISFVIRLDGFISKKHRGYLLLINLLILLLIAQNVVEYLLINYYANPYYRTIIAIFGYAIRPAILVLFLYIVAPDRHHIIPWIMVGVNAALYMTALFSHLTLWISEGNKYLGGPLSNFSLYISVVLLAYLLWLTIRKYRGVSKREIALPVMIVLVIVLGIVADATINYKYQAADYLTAAIVSCNVFYYIWLHMQFVREHEKGLMMEQRVGMMLTQIKPHFLYNSLGAIEELCDSDPKAAKAATVKFSRYLRGNMDSISAEGVIPFEKELSHTKLYLELEQIRFEDALEVRYDITCTDFKLPALTLEPLAENAVRHGVRENDDGRGCVTISTRELSDSYEVSVRDNGPGFDPDSLPDDGETHIGIQNVRDRLEKVSSGILRIESSDQGTIATIIIPKE